MAGEGGGGVKIIELWTSPFVMRARMALRLKGVEYELLEETFGHKSELLLASNPMYKKVPVLFHGDRRVCESMIIVEYVDEVWESGLAIPPADPYERSIHRYWAEYVDDKLCSAMVAIVTSRNEEDRGRAVEQIPIALKHLEEAFAESSHCKAGKRFFGGDAIGYLDIALGSMLGWLRVTGKMAGVEFLDAEKTPLLVGWAQKFCSHETVKDIMPETDKLLEYAMSLQQATS